MAYIPLITICNDNRVPIIEVAEPFEYDATTSTLVDSGRNAQGYVIASVTREDVAKIAVKWDRITTHDWSVLLMAFDKKHGGDFFRYIRFLNQVTNEFEIRQFYVSDRKSGVIRRDYNTGEFHCYFGASMSFIEV